MIQTQGHTQAQTQVQGQAQGQGPSFQPHYLDTVAPSFMQPNMNLGSRTPMHLVHVSNSKLNGQIFSSRSLSIHRRIVIKNFLTVLYQLHPVEWIEESPVDDQDQWMENTLSAAGIGHSDVSTQREYDYGHNYATPPHQHDPSSSQGNGDGPVLSPAAAAAASVVTSRRRPQSLRSSSVPLPRPVSLELPSALQSYLSTVFDVDWSVGLASKEDSLFTSKPALHSPLRSTLAPSSLTLSNPASNASLPSLSSSPSSSSKSQPVQSSRTPSASHPSHSWSNYGKSEYDENDKDYTYSSQAGPGSISSSLPIRSHFDKQLPLTPTGTHDIKSSALDDGAKTHVHNHYHIHIHNYPPQGTPGQKQTRNGNTDRSHPSPTVRSSRYPKPEQQHRPQNEKEPTFPESLSYLAHFPEPPKTEPHVASKASKVAGPLASSSASSSPSSQAVYPPEKSGAYAAGSDEERPYLAVAPPPPVPPRHSRSPPPPPYTQSVNDSSPSGLLGSGSGSGPVHHPRVTKSAPIPTIFSSFLSSSKPQPPLPPSPALLSSSASSLLLPLPVLSSSSSSSSSSLPSSPSSSSTSLSTPSSSSSLSSSAENQKLIEYRQYQERQKMFVREDEDSKDDGRSVGFIRQLFRHGSKKKTPTMAVISAPLPNTTSLLLNSRAPFLLQDLVKQDLIKQIPPIRRTKAG